jgi:peptidoglycan hydrolase CwlO-like protein
MRRINVNPQTISKELYEQESTRVSAQIASIQKKIQNHDETLAKYHTKLEELNTKLETLMAVRNNFR